MEPVNATYEEIPVGATAAFSRTFTQADVDTFATLSGDHNPLHTDEKFAQQTRFERRVCHGLLVQSLLSTLAGMHLPGTHSLILETSSQFRKPVFAGDTLTITGTVKKKQDLGKLLFVDILITNQRKETVLTGAMTIGVQR